MEAVVVTGTSSGIGEASAELLARNGFAVFAGVRKNEDGVRIKARHENIRPLLFDVTDSAAIRSAAKEVADTGLALRGVVNNAGIAVGGPLEYLPIGLLRHQFDVNVIGQIAVAQAFLPQLRTSHGRLVFVGSVSGRIPVPFLGAYSGSKFALRAMVDVMRMELQPAGVRVALIEPANVKTPIWAKGRAGRDALLRQLGPAAAQNYRTDLEQLARRSERSERTGMPVELVSNAILHALTAARPKTHYMLRSRLAAVVGTLPASFYEAFLKRALRG
jgi:NAD(P)-dependent dehydrogenase (short-subunit alcohol dehydrogenase family)